MTPMKEILYREEVLPFSLTLGLLILVTLFVDALLHFLQLAWLGRWLGLPGTLLILCSFAYSLRKRKLIQFSSPKILLRIHEAFALLGALMLMIHAGIHFHALLPWLALLAMLVDVISGLVGRVLLSRSLKLLKWLKDQLKEAGKTPAEIEELTHTTATATAVMKQWRQVHYPITLVFVVLALLHILSIWILGTR